MGEKYTRLCQDAGLRPLPDTAARVSDANAYPAMTGHLMALAIDARDLAERAARGEDVRYLAKYFLRQYGQ